MRDRLPVNTAESADWVQGALRVCPDTVHDFDATPTGALKAAGATHSGPMGKPANAERALLGGDPKG
ncbi:hypothetical protein GCM10022394_31270 [Zobellella aerophila]|uniref:Uncharacterized protein n=1 Tax=Zobellella aerophila TaxID=870480 RepID=A0ABP6WB39_9GAMM